MAGWNRKNAVASFIRKRRKEAGLTQQGLADYAGIGLRLIRDIEQGKPTVQLDKVNTLLAFFGYELAPQRIEYEEG